MDALTASPLATTLLQLDDPPVVRTRLHSLMDILALSAPQMTAGTDSFLAIALFGQVHQTRLCTFLKLPHGVPSHNPARGCRRTCQRGRRGPGPIPGKCSCTSRMMSQFPCCSAMRNAHAAPLRATFLRPLRASANAM